MATLQSRQTPPLYQIMDENDAVSGLVFPQIILLDNGIPVHIIRADEQEIFKMALIFKAGSFFQDKMFTAYFTRKLLVEGTEKMTALQIAEVFDFCGASLEITNSTEFITFNILCLIKYLDKIIEVISDLLFHSVFPFKELQLHKENKTRDILLDEKKVRVLARHHFCTMLFGKGHPYGSYPAAEYVADIQREDIVRFYDLYIKPGNFRVIISGKINDDSLKNLNRIFGSHKFKHDESLFERKYLIAQDINKHQFFPVEDVVQSAFRIGNHAVNRLNDDYAALTLMNTLLGGYFGSRLMRNLREDKGYTYGVSSTILSFPEAAYFFVASEVKGIYTKDAINEVYLEMKKLRDEIVSDDELERVKNYMFGRFLRSIDGVYAQSELLTELFRYDLDFSYCIKYLNSIRNINSVEVNAMASKYLKEEDMFEVIAGIRQ